jgi:hypothetical protein
MKYKIRYWDDRTSQEVEEIYETDDSIETVRGHAHMRSVEPIQDKKEEVKPSKKK